MVLPEGVASGDPDVVSEANFGGPALLWVADSGLGVRGGPSCPGT